MGAHTIGKFDATNSMFKYFWSREEEIILNIIFKRMKNFSTMKK